MTQKARAAGITVVTAFFLCAFPPHGVSEPQTGPLGARELVLMEGEKLIDTPYASPPRPPATFDCSGFVSYIFGKHAGLSLPVTSGEYTGAGRAIDFKDAKPGDLLIFTSRPGGSRINHVSILAKKSETGELRGSLLLHAVSIPARTSTVKGAPATTGVKISELGKTGTPDWQNEYFLSRFFSVRRVIED